MLAGAAMASAPAVRTAPAGARAGTGFRGAVGSRAGLIAPSARRPDPRAAPKPVRAGEALDWENDDFVPASKANKKKKSKGGNAAQKQKQKSKPAAPKAEALDWENDDFVPAGKAKKNKKKPKKGGDDGAAQDEPAPPPVIAEVPDWENEEFVPASKKKDKKGKKGKQASEPVASVIEPAVEPEPVVEATAAAAAAETAAAAEAAAAAAVAQAEAAAAAAAAAKAKAEAEAAKAKAEAEAAQAKAEAEAEAARAAAAAAPEPEPEPEPEVEVAEEVEEIDEAALEKATKAAIRAAEEEAARLEEERLAAIDWTAPDEEVDDGNPIPMHLRDIFAKDAKPSKRRSSGTVTTGVRMEGVKKSFKGMEVLKGVSWDCQKGEKVGLVGWNGAGKTTQLRIITGEMEADEGERSFADKVKIATSPRSSRLRSQTPARGVHGVFGEESVYQEHRTHPEGARERTQHGAYDHPPREARRAPEAGRQARPLQHGARYRQDHAPARFVPEDNDSSPRPLGLADAHLARKNFASGARSPPMDEPTNYLDLDAIQWLEEYLGPGAHGHRLARSRVPRPAAPKPSRWNAPPPLTRATTPTTSVKK